MGDDSELILKRDYTTINSGSTERDDSERKSDMGYFEVKRSRVVPLEAKFHPPTDTKTPVINYKTRVNFEKKINKFANCALFLAAIYMLISFLQDFNKGLGNEELSKNFAFNFCILISPLSLLKHEDVIFWLNKSIVNAHQFFFHRKACVNSQTQRTEELLSSPSTNFPLSRK